MIIRHAVGTEFDAICALHRVAFGVAEGDAIATLVAQLAQDPTAAPRTSLVADLDGAIIGHVLFSAVRIPPHAVSAQILAPLGVAPMHQRQGIGSQLVRAGLAQMHATGCELVFVYGNPVYYRRFGFIPATPHKLIAPHPIPPAYADAWMVRALSDWALEHCHGTVRCAETLHHPQYWEI